MSSLKFSANVSTMFTEYNFLARFEEAKKHGFKFYEMQSAYDFAPEDIKQAANGMQCVLMNSVGGDTGYGIACMPGSDMQFCQGIQKITGYYNAFGVQKLHILAGLKDPEVPHDQAIHTFVENLKSIKDYLENFNMIGLIEPICAEVKENYFLDSFDLAVDILQRVNCENIKLLLDIYHLQKITGDVKGNLKKYYPYAGHIQISQDPDRREPFFPGGKIDYNFVFKFLEEQNHQDPVGLEYFPSTTTEESLEWLEANK